MYHNVHTSHHMQQLRYCREDVTLSAGEGFTEHIRGQWAFDAPKAWRGVAGSGEVSCLKVERSDKSVLLCLGPENVASWVHTEG